MRKRTNYWRSLRFTIKENNEKIMDGDINNPDDAILMLGNTVKKMWGWDSEDLLNATREMVKREKKNKHTKRWL